MSATMAGQVKIVITVNQWLDVFMALAWIILTLACAIAAGKVTFVTSCLVIWIAIMASVILQAMELTTSASVSLDGEERVVTSAGHTGGAPIKGMMLAANPMSVSAPKARQIQMACATIPCSSRI